MSRKTELVLTISLVRTSVFSRAKPWRHSGLRATLLLSIAIGLLSFGLHYSLARMLYSCGVITPINLLFDSDTGWYLNDFAHGTGGHGSYGGRDTVHPNVANFVHPPVAVVSATVDLVHGVAPRPETRYALALTIAPLAASARLTFLFLALRTAGLNIFSSLAGVALNLFSFSGLLFGAIPESFGLSGAVLAFAFYLVAVAAADGRIDQFWWLFAGICLCSVTVTNIVPFAILLGLILYFQTFDFWSVARRTAMLALAASAVTGILFVLLTVAHGAFGDLRPRAGQLRELHPRLSASVVYFPMALSHTIVPPQPHALMMADNRVIRYTFRDDTDQISADDKRVNFVMRASASPRASTVRALLFISALVLGLCSYLRIEGALRIVYIAALSQVFYHWVFHSLFGNELFLYSQHWHIPLTVLISLGMADRSWTARISRLIVLALTVLAAINSAMIFQSILAGT